MEPPEPIRPAPILISAEAPQPGRPSASRFDSKMSVHREADDESQQPRPSPLPKSQSYMDSLVAPSQDKFAHIAQVQAEKESEAKERIRERHRQAVKEKQQQLTLPDHRARAEAALRIQRTFRGYRARRELEGFNLDATTRWVTAIREAQFRQSQRPHARNSLDGVPAPAALAGLASGDAQHASPGNGNRKPSLARQNWKKAGIIARRAGHDELDSGSSQSSSDSDDDDLSPEQKEERRKRREKAIDERKHEARMMGLQYFLEMVDLKHRYGSNLRTYHEEWKKSDTKENYFYWLDYGEGKNIELEACPRDRLEREQVRYLSREERQYYLATVDDQGRLCWAKNGARIDTTEKYKDSIHGIVPADDPTPPFNPTAQPEDDNDDDDGSSSESEREADRAAKYATPGFDEAKGMTKVSHLSASTIFNKLLRKSVRKNTWIFVADTSFRLYVGIKNSGAFQHSSFLQGSRISAAGLIKVKNGRLTSLSPLSGHYRPPAANFRAFTKSLKASGADMTHVSISKSYTVLVGLEAYIRTRTKGKQLVGKVVHHKDKVVNPEEVKRRTEEAADKSQSAEKERQVLKKEEQEREENKASVKAMQMLKIIPGVPKGQKGDTGEEKVHAAV